MKRLVGLLVLAAIITSCSKEEEPIVVSPDDFHRSVDKVVEIMVHDIFSPPVASRVFAYPNIAAYEIIAQQNDTYNPLEGQLPGLVKVPKADTAKPINFQLAALIAHMEVSKKLIFSEDRIEVYRDSLFQVWEDKNESEFTASRDYALAVADHIAIWMDKDNYKQTRTMPKFSVYTDLPGRWQPTPPDYMDGIEPHWMKIRPFAIDSASQFKPVPPPEFSLETDSDFYKELKEVYDISNEITLKGDESEEVAIARFWDCNPYVSVHKGHMMFATKKITPGAHWIGIAKIASVKSGADFDKTIYAHTKTAIAIADAFISCWDEKYRSNLIRPETLINEHIDENWRPVLQTPPFPEYVSGHSVVSGAAAEALTYIFGEGFAFLDDTELPYGLPVRSFESFRKAAAEAAISRMYGGIHYRAAVDIGLEQGKEVGKFVVQKLKMTNNDQVSN